MLPHIYDANDADADDAVSFSREGRSSRLAGLSDLPDVYLPRRRRMPFLAATALSFATVTGLFYGGEALLPDPYKPSVFIGGYGKEIEKARKAGELDSQVHYEAQLRGVEVQYQTKLKGIETAANQLQERCRAGFQNFNNLYQAAYQRANIYAQSTADSQKLYLNTRYQTVHDASGGDIGIANAATSVGYILKLFDPQLGQQAMDFGEAARQQALARLDAAAQGGVTISIKGWDSGLPDPASLSPMAKCEMPVIATGDAPSPITVPELPVSAQPSKEG